MYESFARAEAQHYSDRLREQEIAECEWHEGYTKRDCPECEAGYEAYQESLVDAAREDRAFGND